MADPVASLVKGTLDLLVLRTLQLQPLHGAAIAERIFETTRGHLPRSKPGSLLPALHRLEQDGWIQRGVGCFSRRTAASNPTV